MDRSPRHCFPAQRGRTTDGSVVANLARGGSGRKEPRSIAGEGRTHRGSSGHIGTPRKRRQAGSPTDGAEIFRQRVYNINTGVRCLIRRGRVRGRGGPSFRIGRPSFRNGKFSFRIGNPTIRIAKPNIRIDARVVGLTGPIFGFNPAGKSDRSASSVGFRNPAGRVAKASVQEVATLGHPFITSYSLWVPCYRCRCCLARPSVDDGCSALW